ncbi:MAG: polyprenyl diphosphate synthase [archaeon]|nr:polyprenyl diphosphate synthase [archaeon]
MICNCCDKLSNCFISLLTNILKLGGNIPKHIAIIMDGSRRYAKKYHLKEGHSDGTKTLLNVINWSIDLGIKELTVFAFSIDNFNRSDEEISLLNDLFQRNFKKYSLSDESQKLGLKICVYGNWEFFDDQSKKDFKLIEETTKNQKKIKLNVCLGYNSTEELYQARNKISNLDENNYIKQFESNLYGGYNCNPELLIRTSGETRLSNFLLYQCRFSKIIFVEKYWPELNFFDYFIILLRYSKEYYSHIKTLKKLEKDNNFKILSKES